MERIKNYKIKISCILFFLLFSVSGCIFGGKVKLEMYVSSDGGNTFTQFEVSRIRGKPFRYPRSPIYTIAINPNNPQIWYAGTRDRGIYKTSDDGKSFQEINNGIKLEGKNPTIKNIIINPQNPETIFAAGIVSDFGKIYRSSDGGENWKEVFTESRQNRSIISLDISRTNPNVLGAAGELGNIYASKDGGISWTTIGWFDDVVNAVAIDPTNSQVILVGNQQKGAYRTDNFGTSWQPVTQLIGEDKDPESANNRLSVGDIEFAPTDNLKLYMGSKNGLFTSFDNGINWQEVTTLLPKDSPPLISDVEISYNNPNLVYFSIPNIVYKSENKDGSWFSRQLTLDVNALDITLDPKNSNKVYIGTGESGGRPLFDLGA